MRNLIIVGNGLGLSIDRDFFSLERAMRDAWESDVLQDDEKELIRRCLPDGADRPTEEDELEDLQRIVNACATISEFELKDRLDAAWLTETGQAFPDAIRFYVHAVASQFHSEEHNAALEPPLEFLDALNSNLSASGSTIATTNYDACLYRPLNDRSAFRGYNTLDGFQGRPIRFAATNLRRQRDRKGYYLHLHGSPLFMTENGQHTKISREEIRQRRAIASSHIVLTNTKYKPQLISASPILSAYWKKLKDIRSDFERIVWFGHSGRDPHLNQFIARYFGTLPITIVEWSGVENQTDREHYWREKFQSNTELDLVRLDDICSFSDW